MNRFSFALLLLVFGLPARAQLAPPNFERYEGPIVSDPVEVRYGWRSGVSGANDRVAVSYGRWDGAGQVRIFELETGEALHTIATRTGVRGLVSLPDGEHFATGDFDGNVVIRRFSDAVTVAQWKAPKGSVEMLTFSPDGKDCFFSSNGDYAARADAMTGKIDVLYAGHTDNVYDIALSADGKTVVSSTANGLVFVHDANTGELRHEISHPGQVAAVHWIGETDRFVSVAGDSRICLWDATTGELVAEAKSPSSLYSVDVDKEAKTIVTGGRGDLQFWDAGTLEPIKIESAVPNPFQGHDSILFGSTFVGDDMVLSSGWDKQAFLWDRQSGAMIQLYDATSSPRASVLAIAGNRLLTRAVVARADKSMALLDVSTLKSTRNWSLDGLGPVAALCQFDDDLLLIATEDNGIYQQDLNSQTPGTTTKKIGQLTAKVIAMWRDRDDGDDATFYLVTEEGIVSSMNRETGEETERLKLSVDVRSVVWSKASGSLFVLTPETELFRFTVTRDDNGLWSAEASSSLQLPAQDGIYLTAISSSRILVQLGATNGMILDGEQFRFVGQLPAQDSARTAVVASFDGRSILSGTDSGALSVFQSPAWTVAPIAEGRLPTREIRFLCFAPDGKTIRVGSIDCDFATVSTDDLKPTGDLKRMPPFGIASSARSRDRTIAVVGSWNGQVLLTEIETKRIVCQLPPEGVKKTGKAGAVTISQDNKRVAVGTLDGIVRLYDVDPPRLVWTSDPFGETINEVAISDDGKYVAASTGDYRRYQDPGLTVLIEAETGKTAQIWNDALQKVTGVAFTPDSSKVVACGNDAFRTYDVKTRALLHAAPLHGCQRVRFIDESRCVVTQYPGKLLVWDTARNLTLGRMTGHRKPDDGEKQPQTWSIDVSEDRTRLISSDTYGQLYLWPLR